MPARPAYFHRLTEALETFRHLKTDWIDRRTVEEVLGVSKTVAWRVLRSCGASDGPGNTVVCRRLELVQALEALQETGGYQHEIRRRNRVEQNLDLLLQSARSRHIQVAREDRGLDLASTRFAELPAGIELSPSRLIIDFSGTQDFLAKFGAVVFALQNDYERVEEFIANGQN